MSDVIDALKRLERLGSETSKTTGKLLDATRLLASRLEQLLPEGFEISSSEQRPGPPPPAPGEDDGRFVFFSDGEAAPVAQMFNPWYRVQSGRLVMTYKRTLGDRKGIDCVLSQAPARSAALAFAEDIANGVLDLFVQELKRIKATDEKAAPVLERMSAKP